MRLVIICTLLILADTVLFAQVNLYDGLIGCYRLDGDATDGSSAANHGVVFQAVATTDRFGNPNAAYSFDGDDYIAIPASILKNPSYSYSVWAKVTQNPASGQSGIVFSIGDQFDSKHQTINVSNVYAEDGFVGWNVGGYNNGFPTTTSLQSFRMPNVSEWYHLVVTRDNFIMKMYINGVFVREGSTNGNNPYYGQNTNALLGMRCNYTQAFRGAIDDFVIYDRILTEEEVSFLYAYGTPCRDVEIEYTVTCGIGNVELRAYWADDFFWYDESGELLFSGSPFNTHISETTQFYVQPVRQGHQLPMESVLVEMPEAPEISLDAPADAKTDDPVVFNVLIDGDQVPDLFTWTFNGHATTTTSGKMNYVFTTPGVHSVTVRALFSNGCSRTGNASILVTADEPDLLMGLVGCYVLNGDANDGSGNGNHGTVAGAVPTVDRFNEPNSAYLFDGVDDYISLPVDDFRNPVYTYAAWAKTLTNPKDGNSGIVFSIGDAVDSKHQTINVSNVYSSVGFVGWNVGGYNQGSPSTTSIQSGIMPTVGQWYHIAITRDKHVMKMYLNGEFLSAKSTNGNDPYYGMNTVANLGLRCNFDQPFHGMLDDFVVYGRSLSAEEIRQLYESGLPCQEVTVADYSRCGGGLIEVKASGALSYNWYDKDGSLVFTGNPFVHEITESASFFVEGISGDRTLPRKQFKVSIHPQPQLTCAFPDIELYAENILKAEVTDGTPDYSYQWTVDERPAEGTNTAEFQFVPRKRKVFSIGVTVTDAKGCVASCHRAVNTVDYFFIPNVITTNGDQLNESFNLFRKIDGQHLTYQGADEFFLQVFNRWGDRVFSTRKPADGWNGGDNPDGAYFYTIKLGAERFKGWVHLVKP